MHYSFVIATAMLALITSPALAQSVLTEQEQRAAFAAADTNGDGVIDEAEFAADAIKAFVHHTPDGDEVILIEDLPPELHAHAAEVDANGDGQLSFEEVRAFKLRQFHALDTNNDHVLTLDEVLMEGPPQ